MPKKDKRAEANAALPVELRDIFDALVEDYMVSCEARLRDHSRRVNYNILADLVRAGWRKQD